MFKVGNKVICVQLGSYADRLKAGEQYVIVQIDFDSSGEDLIYLEGLEQSCGGMYPWRFELAESIEMGLTSPDPSKPYPNPELEMARQRQQELLDYKREMRDYLYGTTNEGE